MNAPMPVRAAVLKALHAAGGEGATIDELISVVERLRDGPVRRTSVIGAISELNTSKSAVILSAPIGKTLRYTLAGVADKLPPKAQAGHLPRFEPERLPVTHHTSITAMAFGDPLPGRSALDQRRNLNREDHL